MKKFRILGPGDKDQEIVAELEAYGIADEYHTMHELYQHRMALTIALTKAFCSNYNTDYFGIRSKLHADGTMFEGDYFIIGICYMAGGKPLMIISYHYETKYWYKFEHCETLERAPIYDGHTSQDVIERLMSL